MSVPSVRVRLEDALAHLEAAVDELGRASLAAATDDSVLDAWRRVETARRRLDPLDHRIIGEVNDRTLAEKYACRNTAGLVRQLLHLHPSEAAGRVKAAQVLGPRRATTGEPLEPTYPKVVRRQPAVSAGDHQRDERLREEPPRARAKRACRRADRRVTD